MRTIAVLSIGFLIGLAMNVRADDLSVKLVSITRPVHPGGTVTLVIQTRPDAICIGTRQGHYGNDYSIKLPARTSGIDGQATWQWNVLPGNRPIGRRGVHVACEASGETSTLDTQFDVE